MTKSKYNEDVRINNHTCCWGSFWKDGLWGYKCCQSTIKMSYCVGLKNKEEDKTEEKEVNKEATWQQKVGLNEVSDKNVVDHASKNDVEKSLVEQHMEKISKKEKKKHKKSKKKKSKKSKKKKRKRESSSSDSSE